MARYVASIWRFERMRQIVWVTILGLFAGCDSGPNPNDPCLENEAWATIGTGETRWEDLEHRLGMQRCGLRLIGCSNYTRAEEGASTLRKRRKVSRKKEPVRETSKVSGIGLLQVVYNHE